MTRKTQGKGDGDEGLTFEQAIARLEDIAQKIESGEIGLEQSIAEYERGIALIRRCRDILQKAEQRVDELNRQAAAPDGPVGSGKDAANDDEDA